MDNVVEIILNVIIGIIVPIFVTFKSNLQKEECSFYAYIELYYESFVEKLTKIWRFELVFVVMIQIILIICNYLHLKNFNNIDLDKLTTLGGLVLLIFVLASSFTITLFFKPNKKLDELISSNGANLNRWRRNLDVFIAIICVIAFVLFLIIEPNNLSLAIAVIYVTFVLSLCISGFYTSYVANYVKARTFYRVDSINIKISSEEKTIANIINYRLKGDRYIIRLNENGNYISLEVPSSKIEYIEKKINKEETIIRILNRGKEQK